MDLFRSPLRLVMAVRRACLLGLAIGICVVTMGVQHGYAKAPSEFQVKAAFLYNFAKFVEWPSQSFADSNAPVVIGVLGEGQFVDAIEQIGRGKTIDGRRLVTKRVSIDSNLAGCHVLFISAAEKRHIGRALERVKDSSVLTVGETDGFMQSGGVIGFVVDDNRIGFEINTSAAKRKHLKISSQLLKLAKNVKD